MPDVDEVGHVQQAWNAAGHADLAWPGGTLAGHLALVECDHSTNPSDDGPDPAGWTYVGSKVWSKRLTSADIAGDLPVTGKLTSMLVLTSCGGVGRTSQTSRIYADDVGGAGFFLGWTQPYRTSLAGSTGRLGSETTAPTDSHKHAAWLIKGTTPGYRSLSSPSSSATFRGFELWPLEGPDAPTLLAPTPSAELDRTTDTVFEVQHNSTSGSAQEAIKVRVRAVSTGTWYYVLPDGSLSTTETTLTQSSGAVTLNAITGMAYTLSADQAYEWQSATYDQGAWSDWSDSQQFTARNPPAVTSITVTAPPQDLTPDIAWTMTAGVGSQTAWRVRITESGISPDAPLWDSGVQPGTDLNVTVPVQEWVNGGLRYAWVQTQQDGGLWSPWTVDDTTFAVTWTPPAAPSSVTSANQTNGPLRVTVAGIDAAAHGVQVAWSTDAGATWAALVDTARTGASMVFDNPLAPYGIAATYRARAYEVLDGIALYSDWATSSALASTDTRSYLVSLTDVTDYLHVEIPAHEDTRVLEQGIQVSGGLGATRARVQREVPRGQSGSTPVRVENATALVAVVTWLTTMPGWFLRSGPDHEDGTLVDVSPTRMTLAKPTTWRRPFSTNAAARVLTFEWVEQ